MRYSFQKEAILNILHSTKNHYSVEEIHMKLMKLIPKVSLMTVYRNLSKLTNEGHLLPFHIDNVLHYCGNNKSHLHLHCVDCDDVLDYYNEVINKVVLNHIKSEKFFPLSNGMVIKGLCKGCKDGNYIDDKNN